MGTVGPASWAGLTWDAFLADIHLVGVTIENWAILHKTHFDFFTEDEPHCGQSLYLEVATGRYYHKVFGRTIGQGQVSAHDPAALRALAQDLFQDVAICRGFDAQVKNETQSLQESHWHPYPRKTSLNCQVVFKLNPADAGPPAATPLLCAQCARAIKVESLEPPALNVNDYLSTPWPPGQPFKREAHGLVGDQPEPPNPPGHSGSDRVSGRRASPQRKVRLKPSLVHWTEPDDEDALDMELTYSSEDHHEETEEEEEEEEEEAEEEADLPAGAGKPRPRRRLKKFKIDPNSSGRTENNIALDREDAVQRRPRKGRTCNHCHKYFSSGNGYRNHRARLRRDERRLSCKHCDSYYYSFSELAEHIVSAHRDAPISFQDHLQNPEEIEQMARGHKCSICSLYFNSHVLVFRHKAFYHELGDFFCEACDEHLLTYYHLVMHNYNAHDKPTPFLAPPVDDLVRTEQEDGKIKYSKEQHICPDCKKVFKYDSDWGTHMKTTHSWWVFECQDCDEMCHYAKDFSAHIRHFHGDNPVVHCPKCFEEISLKDNPDHFNEHFRHCVKRTQAKKRENISFQCDKCGKNYSTQYLLQCHLMSHEGVEKYICEKCDYGTNLKKVMEDHQKAHMRAEGLTQDNSGTNLFFHCDQCPKRFSRNLTLNRHIKSVHEGIKRVMKCKTCDATFNSSSMLYIHKRRVHGFVSNLNRRGRRPH
ncbi:hypothetical protein TCAL_12505 [Tigriopus californicus]|uniref:C2H2-type domain-containing protein n=1 Tax=Tigriopus californicus TaxID=6832 RepID=A0A553NBJ2_TIGCA|nr:zinc finger protein 93-like [Tigriopus californicus]TRY62813.1 hypothetical protein TCAL_12505 [Tigriopus californicus]|eukprot:TCALIF_12505-PA protein Name:"Similar to ZNF676 Zinc finger protein 676 (Homo sapiens)" AED:0.15 eAED:0.44 QI:0/-1/0/1/-1/1/1/0/703